MLLVRKQVKRARDEGSKCEKQMWKANVLKLFFHTLIFFVVFLFLFFCCFLLFFYYSFILFFCLFFIFCFWLVFILTLSTFAFSICKGEGISFLYFSQRLFILLLTTAVVTLNTSSIHSFVFLFEPDKDKNKKMQQRKNLI